jgi:hypothetical protein
MRENAYQQHLIKKLNMMFPGCVVMKNDSSYRQGFPDLTIFFEDRWAVLEIKASRSAMIQPNQFYYVDRLDKMSFAAFIYPENEEEVLDALQLAFQSGRATRLSKRKQVSLD